MSRIIVGVLIGFLIAGAIFWGIKLNTRINIAERNINIIANFLKQASQPDKKQPVSAPKENVPAPKAK